MNIWLKKQNFVQKIKKLVPKFLISWSTQNQKTSTLQKISWNAIPKNYNNTKNFRCV